MFKRWRRWLFLGLPLLFSVAALAVVEVEPVKERIKQAILNNDYYTEYTETAFRFGRRREVMGRMWVKDDLVIRQIRGPLWQWGETAIQTATNYYYYIPGQKSCLKVDRQVSGHKNRLRDWDFWINKISKIEATSSRYGRTVQIVSGNEDNTYFKLSVDQVSFLPVALEYYRDQLLLKTVVFQKLEGLPKNFDFHDLLPAGDITWYDDEVLFWQTVSLPRVQNGVNFTILQPSYLPEGFIFKKAVLEELSSATVVHLIYEGDDKQILSVFEREKLSDNQRLEMVTPKMHQSQYKISSYQWAEKQVHLAIIGPVSPEEIKKMVHSFK